MNPAAALALKLVLTPVLVGGASLAGRRWGSSVGGWLIGIPFTSAPIAFFLALDLGPSFAARAAEATMAGAIAQAAFCVAYAWTAQRAPWSLSLPAATGAYAAAAVVLLYIPLRGGLMFVVIIAVLVLSLVYMPLRQIKRASPVTFPAWDMPLRMIVATGFVLVLTTLAPLLGARLAGLLAPFPLYGAVLAGFAHRMEGSASAVAVLRGLLLGLFAFTSFFLVLSGLLAYGIALAFAIAIVVALAIQTAALLAGRRLGIA